jgi:hypothetical protein
MSRFVLHAGAALEVVRRDVRVSGAHQLLAPTLLRSQTLSALHEAVARGELPAGVARDHLARIGRLPIRLLGDAVLRRRAWDVADGSAGPPPTTPSTWPSHSSRPPPSSPPTRS